MLVCAILNDRLYGLCEHELYEFYMALISEVEITQVN